MVDEVQSEIPQAALAAIARNNINNNPTALDDGVPALQTRHRLK